MTYRDITHPNHKCAVSMACPSVSISEDGKMLRIVGNQIALRLGMHPEEVLDIEVTVQVSTDLVRDSLCQADASSSAVSSSPAALQSGTEQASGNWIEDFCREHIDSIPQPTWPAQTEESSDITNKLFSASDICEQAVTELLAARSRIAELEGTLQARNQPDDLCSENDKLREAMMLPLLLKSRPDTMDETRAIAEAEK